MAATKRLAINVVMNWAAMAVNMVVPFFLMPYVVKHLGKDGYGVWVLAVGVVGYLNLLDLGLRSAVIRFVSKAQAKGDLQDASHAINAALWVRLLIAVGVAFISVGLAAAVPYLFKTTPPPLMHAAQVTTLLCALGVAVSLVSGVFSAVLAAISRFDLLSFITMGQTILRAAGVLLILRSGRGLIPLAAWELTVLVLVGLATTLLAMNFFPHCRVRPGKPDMQVLRMIWSYSFTTFVFIIAVQIITNTDNIVIGAFLSVGAVAFYSIGGSLIGYAYQVSNALSGTFTPMASGIEASGNFEQLRTMLLRGTQATLGLALPIGVVLAVRGETFIDLWLGSQYGAISEKVLRILLISMYLGVANGTASSIMMAIERHKPVARLAVYEAVLNLGLSIALVKTIGIYGVAWGTSLSMIITHLSFWPRYINKVLEVKPSTYLLEGWGRVTLAVVPFAAVTIAVDHYSHPLHLITYFAQIAITLPVYALGIAVGFREEVKLVFSRWQLSRRPSVLQAS